MEWRKCSVVFLSMLLCACAKPEKRANAFDPQNWTLIDLTHPFEAAAPLFPGGVPFKLELLENYDKEGYILFSFHTGEHTGTHVDAPMHFSKGSPSIDKVTLDQLSGPLVVIDVQKDAAAHADLAVQVSHIAVWEAQHGRIPDGAFVAINSGWSKRWSDPKAYLNMDAKGVMRFPGFSLAATEFLLDQRAVRGIGVDTLSADPGPSAKFEEHHSFLAAGKVNLENLANLDQVPAAGAYIFAAALPIKGGSGSPARIFAAVPKQ